MDATLNKLIELDKQARDMVAGAQQYNSDVMNHLSSDIEALRQKYTEEAEHRLDVLRQNEENTSHTADKDIDKRYQDLTEMLEDDFAKRREELCSQLFKRCIGR